jgi:hypothetical protein
MRWIDRRQFVRSGRICDPGSRLVAPELISGVFRRSSKYSTTHHLAKMIADPSFIDLDHLTHRLIVTHRLLLHYMKKPSILKVRKILDVGLAEKWRRLAHGERRVILRSQSECGRGIEPSHYTGVSKWRSGLPAFLG